MYGMPSQHVDCPTKSYGQQCYFQILSTFSYIFVGHWPANTIWWWAEVISFMWLHIMTSGSIDLKMIVLGYIEG